MCVQEIWEYDFNNCGNKSATGDTNEGYLGGVTLTSCVLKI